MIEISLNKINKNYGFNQVLKDFSFEIKTGEKIALIGSNGSGKTTILRIIMGLEDTDNGQINIRRGINIGYLTQIPSKEESNIKAMEVYLRGVKDLLKLEKEINDFTLKMTDKEKDIKLLTKMQEEFRIKGGYELNKKINTIKNGFKLSDTLLDTPYNNLSGGEKTIINLASLILSEPDVLLLDEPTNHLDIETLEWLEEYLNNYKGAVLIVSHDRYFLDKIINKIVAIENCQESIYHGNYTYYLKESEKRLLLEFQNYKNQQKEIKALKESIERLRQWGQKSDNPIFFRRAASMQKRLDKIQIIEKPVEKKELPIKLNVTDRSGNEVLKINKLNLSIENKELLKDAKCEILYKDKVCLMGKNGSGKTTLIKNILNNTHDEIKIGTNIKIGYIPQEIRFDNENMSIYEYMRSIYSGSEASLRSKLYKFYFGEETINKKLSTLSGGEKVRIKLLELILSNANFLILDEPTNHIDIDTKEILEESLIDFEGTILFISHDRYFINKISTKIIRIENKKLIAYNGNYDEIKNIKVSNEEIKQKIEKNDKISINGSNRIKEIIKDSKIEKIYSKNKEVYKIQKKSKINYLYISNHLSQESIRLEYLKDRINIPEKIFYEKYNDKSYILTKEVKGIKLCDNYFINKPLEGLKLLIKAINDIYTIDYKDCMIDETIDKKINRFEQIINKMKIEEINKNLINKFHTKESIIKYIKGNKPKQIIGFTHGKLNLENIVVDNNENIGFLSVDEAGLSDIYYDLVSCEISIEKYYGKEYIDIFYNELGIEKDNNKSEYYRVLLSI